MRDFEPFFEKKEMFKKIEFETWRLTSESYYIWYSFGYPYQNEFVSRDQIRFNPESFGLIKKIKIRLDKLY